MLLLLLPLLWEGSLCQRLEVQPSLSVLVGMCVYIPCAFDFNEVSLNGSKPLYGYWFREGTNVLRGRPVATNDPRRSVEEQARGRFHLLGDPRMKNCSLRITDTQFSDTGSYYFRLDYGYDAYSYLKDRLYVNVTDLIQKPDISIPEVLELGSPVTLKCTFPWACGENRPLTFSWMGAALSSKPQSSGPSPSSEVSFIPGRKHHGTNLTCQVTLSGGHFSSKRTIQLNVSYAVQNVTITVAQDNRTSDLIPGNSSALVVKEGQSIQLLCAANSNPPASLSWILGNQTLASSQPSENGVLPLDLPHLGPADGGTYACLAQNPLGSKQASLRVSVQYPPRMLSPSCSWVQEGLSCTCSVQAEPAPSLRWWVGGRPVEGNGSSDTFQVISKRSGPWTNSSLRVKVDRVPDTTVSCEGKNPQGTHTLLFQLLPVLSAQEHSSWPLMLTLLRGALMGAGFLLTYGLTWLHYTRKPLGREQPPAPQAAPPSR
ncbi:sialic acid-binding Ig-like lectin 14 isoform X2 [Petaurus breviceps papuanus]|uniref:sialic acid-binding Ig-like lectin 14 isoform X2 n=1 Tax=Petaurus breviceps papuanus TaxID=3040969 RepID=UPI0036DC780C